MTFAMLALICAIALVGPLLALPRRMRVPVALGELAIGLAFGVTGTGWLEPGDATFAFLAEIGFALVLFKAGTQVPVRTEGMRRGFFPGAGRALLIGLLAVPAGLGLAALFGTHDGMLYAVLLASSSAAIIVPVMGETKVTSRKGLELLVQVAIADAVCIIALPLVIAPDRMAITGLGVLAVLALAVVIFFVLRAIERSGWEERIREVSKERGFAVELRVTLTLLFSIAAVAALTHVTVMLAGFALGLAVAAVGEPKRVGKQIFALTEGLFGPIFYVWLGASVNLREVVDHPEAVLLGISLGVGAIVLHLVGVLTRQPWPLALAASAQLGVPIGAVSLGAGTGAFQPGETGAILLGAMVTLIAATLATAPMRHHLEDAPEGVAAEGASEGGTVESAHEPS
ncbi:cation:proton antiporter [Gulosibacter macacae]|uniref:Cation:proton antiporter n=1 Tax=Gulosibacter macacae TaxID=2488791 RepID=A0A3P3VT31_9MICO|nr:cation:proton antiporter [Gulosibacter macacae]RRJ85810.1 cation:proton antiporter [Gulosibacter macacae]